MEPAQERAPQRRMRRWASRACSAGNALAKNAQLPNLLTGFKGEGEISCRQVLRSAQPMWIARAVLGEVFVAPGRLGQVCWQVSASDDGFQVVGQQQRLGARCAGVEVHDAAL